MQDLQNVSLKNYFIYSHENYAVKAMKLLWLSLIKKKPNSFELCTILVRLEILQEKSRVCKIFVSTLYMLININLLQPLL